MPGVGTPRHSWERLRQPLERLTRFFGAIADLHEQEHAASGRVPGCPFGNLSVELATTNPAIRQRVAAIFGRIQARFAALLQAAWEAGEVTLEETDVAEQLLGCLQGAQVLAKTQADPEAIRRMAPAAVAIAREG